MSINTPIQLFDAQELTASLQELYESANGKTKIVRITFTNSTTDIHTVTVHYMKVSGAGSDTDIIANQFSIGPKKSIAPPFLEGHLLEQNGVISMKADDVSCITVHGTGLEIV
jgi:hypothetical protein